jgi:predicted amidohydrolase YtcJ
MEEQRVLVNGNIITMDKSGSRAEALAIEAGRIVRVGSRGDVQPLIDSEWPVTDLEGATVLPGFIDTHQHMMLTGSQAAAVHLNQAKDIDEILSLLAAEAGRSEAGSWVRGSYLNEQRLAEKRMPTAAELDRIGNGHPVFVMHATCHMCSLNTRAMEILNLPPGLDGLDLDAGRPTGVVRDPGILSFVHPAMSRLTEDEVKLDFLQHAARMALEKGVTTLHALDGGDLGPGDTQVIWSQRSKLPVRVVCYNQSMDLSQVRTLGLPRVGGCICADGAFEAHTAALFEPYADDPDNYGELTFSQEVMDAFVFEAHTAGLQIAVHCESERSIEQVLWAMEKALRARPRHDHRHRIEHLELPTERQIERMAAAGIMTGMQPAFIPAFIGQERMEVYGALLGESRLQRVHPYRTILDHGIPICGGSDSPVTPYDPLAGIQAAVNHPNPAQRVTRREALAMFTGDAAWSAFEEADKGSIEAGKLADLVVLGEDPLAAAGDRIRDIPVLTTLVGGKRRYAARSGPTAS